MLRLNRFFWSDGEAGFRRYLALADRFTSRGYLVELQVRYHPSASQEGDIAAWTRHVREVVRRFGANPRVVALQIANEVNLTFSPDSSDGSYDGAREALVQGVIAAKDEARRRGLSTAGDRLQLGLPHSTRRARRASGARCATAAARAFVRAVDWIGLDAYPGTVFPPAESGIEGYRDGMVNAMSTLRCFARIPGHPRVGADEGRGERLAHVPRPLARRCRPTCCDVMVRAVHDFRGTYNVTDYRWFNLRDGDTSSPQPFQHFGLFDSGYVEKPAFAVVPAAGGPPGAAASRRPRGARPRLTLRVRGAGASTRAGALRAGRVRGVTSAATARWSATRASAWPHAASAWTAARPSAASSTARAAAARTVTWPGPRCACATDGWCGCAGRSAPAASGSARSRAWPYRIRHHRLVQPRARRSRLRAPRAAPRRRPPAGRRPSPRSYSMSAPACTALTAASGTDSSAVIGGSARSSVMATPAELQLVAQQARW